MAKVCDHTSVGMIVRKEGKILLIERKKFPPGFAIPAGHVDGDATYEVAAKRELSEEVGFEASDLRLVLDERMENPCRREGGTWHHWKVYEVEVTGELNRSEDETKQAGWYTIEEIKKLSERTEDYRSGKILEEEWEKNPGLEPVMFDLFTKLNLL